MKNKIPIICTIIVIAELAAGLLYIIYDKSCALFDKLNQKNDKIKCQNKLCPHYKDCDISAYKPKQCDKNQEAHPRQQLTEEEQALVEGVEFGRDYNLQVSDKDAHKYEKLINEMKQTI